jgi:hypothetical protein
MNRCDCGCKEVTAEWIGFRLPSGDWVGKELCGVTCARCGREVRLDPAATISLMSHLIEDRAKGAGV